MAVAELALNEARQSVSRYGEHIEHIRQQVREVIADPERRAYPIEFAGVLVWASSIASFLQGLDESWREGLYSGNLEHAPEFDETIRDLYRRWLSTSLRLAEQLQTLEKQVRIASADEFRQRIQEVKDLLTLDHDFFTSDQLVTLRDQAIEEHRSGKTAELKELSD